MKLEDIPQDDSKIFRGQRKVIYATRNGKFEAGKSSGWEAEEFATGQAVDELDQLTKALPKLQGFGNGKLNDILSLKYLRHCRKKSWISIEMLLVES